MMMTLMGSLVDITAPTGSQTPVPTVVKEEVLEEDVEAEEEQRVEEVEETEEVEEADVNTSGVEEHATIVEGVPDSIAAAIRANTPDLEIKGGKGKRKRKRTGETPSAADLEYSPDNPGRILRTPISLATVKRSERLKHKKVKYADMVNGLHYTDEDSQPGVGDAPDTIEEHAVVAVEVKSEPVMSQLLVIEDADFSSDHENKDINAKPSYAEELELKKLRAKGKRRKLNRREVNRLKKLREYMRHKETLRRMREKQKAQIANRHKLNGQKSKRKLLDTHVYTKRMNPEHCYAACPEDFVKEQSQDKVASIASLVKQLSQRTEESRDTSVVEAATRGSAVPPLAVLHRDVSNRSGQRGRCQEGALHLQRLTTKDSICIECLTCKESFSVRRFLKHMHHQNNPDELLEVTLAKRLDLKNPTPSPEEIHLWGEFEKRQEKILGKHRDSIREIKNKTVASNKSESHPRVVHTTKPLDVEIKIRDKSEEPPPAPVPDKDSSTSTNSSNVRQSRRVRKRKQLHPIESYVFSQFSSSTPPQARRARTDAEIENISIAVSPVRAVKVKLTVKKGDNQNTVTKH